jgi:hypothetical protein
VLHTAAGAPFPNTVRDPVLSYLWGYDWNWPVMLALGYHERPEPYALTVSDLGFSVEGPGASWSWCNQPADVIEAIVAGTAAVGEVPTLDATFRNLRIVGEASPSYIFGKNLMDAIVIGTAQGSFTFAGSHFETMWGLPVNFGFLGGGRIQIGGPRAEDRVYMAGADMGGHWCWACTNTTIEATNIEAHDMGGPVVQGLSMTHSAVYVAGLDTYNAAGALLSGSVGQPSTYLWEDNTVRTAGTAFAVVESGDVRSQVVIRNNRIEGLGDGAMGVYAEHSAGAVVTNNRITGTGAAAIALGGDDTGALLKANNLQGWEGPVGIWLGAGTSGNSVVGGGRDLVYDEGTDNAISGVSAQGGAIGQAIRDAMMLRKDVSRMFH